MKIKVIKNQNINEFLKWAIWDCEPSEFPWKYDQEEHCYIIEGKFKVIGEVNTVDVVPGDYVIFPAGLECKWIVYKKIKKYYSFK